MTESVFVDRRRHSPLAQSPWTSPSVSAGDVARAIAPVLPTDPCEYLADRFAADPTLVVQPVVTTDGVPQGLVYRYRLLESLSQRFGRALYLRLPAAQCLHDCAHVFDEGTPLDEVGRVLSQGAEPQGPTAFMVTTHGRYLGVGTSFDVMRALTERNHAELLRLAYRDVLTGLPNRYQFDVSLAEALSKARSNSRSVAVLFVDLDRFKRVNDTYGHMVGDLLLQTVAERLRVAVRETDTVARLGGDEFAIILADVNDLDLSAAVARRVLESCAEPAQLDGHEVATSCSIGVALYPDDASTAPGVVRAADTAVYVAKQARNIWLRFRRDMPNQAPIPGVNHAALRRALDDHELYVVYQPIFSLADGVARGVEALIRWRHPTLADVPACDLIALAEETGLIGSVSEFVVRESLAQARRWETQTGWRPNVAVNISGRQILEGGVADMLVAAVTEAGFAPSRLELELTESTAMRDEAGVRWTLDRLRGAGFRLAIDDFGTGFSTLSRLESVPIDIFKIDRSFVHGIGRPGRAGGVARAILAMAQSLGLTSVAEGIETAEQAAFLSAHGCDLGQGYLLGRPLPPDEFDKHMPAWLRGSEGTSRHASDSARLGAEHRTQPHG